MKKRLYPIALLLAVVVIALLIAGNVSRGKLNDAYLQRATGAAAGLEQGYLRAISQLDRYREDPSPVTAAWACGELAQCEAYVFQLFSYFNAYQKAAPGADLILPIPDDDEVRHYHTRLLSCMTDLSRGTLTDEQREEQQEYLLNEGVKLRLLQCLQDSGLKDAPSGKEFSRILTQLLPEMAEAVNPPRIHTGE